LADGILARGGFLGTRKSIRIHFPDNLAPAETAYIQVEPSVIMIRTKINERNHWCPIKHERFSPLGFFGWVVLPFVLVYGTWNPSGRSFYHWTIAPLFLGAPAIGPVKVLVALLLLTGWVAVIQATRRSLGFGGATLIAAVFGALIWLLIAQGGTFQRHSATALSQLGHVAISLLLAIGMSWAIVRRKRTGQVEVDAERG
jgi:hypothetical protein